MMLPGYEELQPPLLGYTFDAADGFKRKVTGGTPRDQIFAKETLGYINISLALEILDRVGQETVSIGIDQGVKDSIALIEINPEHVRRVSAAALKQPILMGVGTDGMHVLDGHHRLTKMIWQGRRNFDARVLSPEAIEKLQVRTWKQQGEGWDLEYGVDEATARRRREMTNARWTPESIVRKVTYR